MSYSIISKGDYRRLSIFNRCKSIAESKGGKCLSNVYVNNSTPMVWQCEYGHIWSIQYSVIQQGHWCPFCGHKEGVRKCWLKRKRININECKEFVKKYDGECLSDKYIKLLTMMKWRCKCGHVFEKSYNSIKQGHWCPICSKTIISEKLRKFTIDDCKKFANSKDGFCLSEKYEYYYKNLKWKCSEGHVFFISWGRIRGGSWCRICSFNRFRLGIEKCRQIAKERGGECLSTEYVDCKTKMLWKCKYGHTWETIFDVIICGCWCPTCAYKYPINEHRCRVIISSIFNKVFIKCKPFKNINKRYELDCYNGELKLALEYDGYQHIEMTFYDDFNPIYLHNRKQRDLEINELCKKMGIILIRVNYIEIRYKSLVDIILSKLIENNIEFTNISKELLDRLHNLDDVIFKR
jgi:hypothetical protein